MGKVCTSCGLGVDEPKKPAVEAEDCPDCGGQKTVKGKEGEEEQSA